VEEVVGAVVALVRSVWLEVAAVAAGVVVVPVTKTRAALAASGTALTGTATILTPQRA